jgi:hypothetical protein
LKLKAVPKRKGLEKRGEAILVAEWGANKTLFMCEEGRQYL